MNYKCGVWPASAAPVACSCASSVGRTGQDAAAFSSPGGILSACKPLPACRAVWGWPCRDRGDGVHPKKKERPIHRPGSAVCPRSRCVRSQLRALLTPPSRRQCSFCLTGPIQLPAALAQGCSEPFLQSGLVRELSSGTGPAPRFCKIRIRGFSK